MQVDQRIAPFTRINDFQLFIARTLTKIFSVKSNLNMLRKLVNENSRKSIFPIELAPEFEISYESFYKLDAPIVRDNFYGYLPNRLRKTGKEEKITSLLSSFGIGIMSLNCQHLTKANKFPCYSNTHTEILKTISNRFPKKRKT